MGTTEGAAQAAEQVTELAIANNWSLRLSPEALDLTSADPSESRHVPRSRALDVVERVGLRFPSPFLVVREPKRRSFRMNAEQARIVDSWLGDQFGPEIDHQLRNRMSSAIPMGLLYFVTDWRDWKSWAFGGLLLAEGLLFRVRPTHWLFLLDLLFWAALIARNVSVLVANPTVLGGVLGSLSLLMFSISLRTFRVLHAASTATPRI